MRCSGKNCPMQYPYDAKACAVLETCPYATLIPYTNADRIRAMSDEELAKTIYGMQKDLCKHFAEAVGYKGPLEFDEDAPDILDWLKQPAKEDA